MTTDAQEVWKIGREAYEFIKNIPEITRADLNISLHTSSNNRRNEFLTEALRCMLTLGQVKKFLDVDGNTVYYWVASYNSRYLADRLVHPHSNPIDCLGPMPGVAIAPEPTIVPKVEGAKISPDTPAAEAKEQFLNTEFKSPNQKMMERVQEGLNGLLKDVYTIMMAEPTRLFRTSDECFKHLHANDMVRAQSIGRVAKMGFINKYGKALTGDRVYTIAGDPPEGYEEMDFKPTAAALKKKQAAEEAAERQRIIQSEQERMRQQEQERRDEENQRAHEEAEDTDVPDADDTHEEDLHEEIEDSLEEPIEEIYEPVVHFTSDQKFVLVREDGTQVDFSEAESAAMRRMIKNINIDRLRD